jgi:hypothetical protein
MIKSGCGNCKRKGKCPTIERAKIHKDYRNPVKTQRQIIKHKQLINNVSFPCRDFEEDVPDIEGLPVQVEFNNCILKIKFIGNKQDYELKQWVHHKRVTKKPLIERGPTRCKPP